MFGKANTPHNASWSSFHNHFKFRRRQSS